MANELLKVRRGPSVIEVQNLPAHDLVRAAMAFPRIPGKTKFFNTNSSLHRPPIVSTLSGVYRIENRLPKDPIHPSPITRLLQGMVGLALESPEGFSMADILPKRLDPYDIDLEQIVMTPVWPSQDQLNSLAELALEGQRFHNPD